MQKQTKIQIIILTVLLLAITVLAFMSYNSHQKANKQKTANKKLHQKLKLVESSNEELEKTILEINTEIAKIPSNSSTKIIDPLSSKA